MIKKISIVCLIFVFNLDSQDIKNTNKRNVINLPTDIVGKITEMSGSTTLRVFYDINKDGFKDSLIIEKSGGSGYSYTKCIFENGDSKEILKIESEGYFNKIRRTIVIPKIFNKKENIEFSNIAEFVLLNSELKSPDQSLQWILDGLNNKYELPKNGYFSEIYKIKTNWYDSLVLPTTYSIKLNPKELKKYNQKVEGMDINDISGCSGWMNYYGHNHYRNKNGDSLTTMYKSNYYSLYRTSHGVIVKKEKKYCWAFVTDSELTGSPSKLRWESIKDASMIDEYIIVVQTNPTMFRDQLFIINLEQGICGNVKLENKFEDFLEIQNKKIIITGIEGENQKNINIEKYFKELSRLSEKYPRYNNANSLE